jgi:hypothetical protein
MDPMLLTSQKEFTIGRWMSVENKKNGGLMIISHSYSLGIILILNLTSCPISVSSP